MARQVLQFESETDRWNYLLERLEFQRKELFGVVAVLGCLTLLLVGMVLGRVW